MLLYKLFYCIKSALIIAGIEREKKSTFLITLTCVFYIMSEAWRASTVEDISPWTISPRVTFNSLIITSGSSNLKLYLQGASVQRLIYPIVRCQCVMLTVEDNRLFVNWPNRCYIGVVQIVSSLNVYYSRGRKDLDERNHFFLIVCQSMCKDICALQLGAV